MTSLILQTGAAENIKRSLPDEDEGVDDSHMDDISSQPLVGKGEAVNQDSALTSSGVEVAFKNVSVTMGTKTLLTDISGQANSSELLAIMGPSGAGKTTLLNCLAGRLPLSSGEITLNGTLMNKDFKRKISYVMQEDIFFPNISLKDTLNFIAMIRLPDTMSRDNKLQRVHEVINALDLHKCQDTIMGDAWCRGLSGGEKKRASIAGELITDPKIIYLDEPTSGLDYGSALSLISTLKHVAVQMNKTVILTIHQPSSHIFFKFDRLLLLCDGQVAYFGPSGNVISFFADLDLHLEPYANPADFVVDKLKEDGEVTKKILSAASRLRITDSSSKQHNVVKVTNGVRQTEFGSVEVSLDNLHCDDLFEDDSKWPTHFYTQFTQLTLRTFRQSKSRIFDKTKILENVVMCILVSLIWFQLPRTEETLTDRMGALFFIVSHIGFGPLFDAAASFPSERVVIHKERASGWYRLSAYYLAKNISELPLTLVQPALFVTVCYWCIGLNGFTAYLISVIVAMTNTLTGQSIGLFLGIAFMDFRRATVMCTLTILFMMLLGGFYTRHLPVWLTWVKYFSFPYYSFHSLLLAEFTDSDPLKCMNSNSSHVFQECASANVTSIPPERVLEYLDITWSFAGYYFPLWLFIIGLRTIGYILLRFVHSPVSV